jgi:hypothetical protein
VNGSGVAIRTAHQSPREEAVRLELLGLLQRYDVSKWTFTGEVIIEQGVVPHSHPVLTLNTLASGDRLLASYLHEQLHWLLAARWADPGMATALRRVASAYPDAPGKDGDGTPGAGSARLHLLLGALQVDALSVLIGADRTNAVVANLIQAGIYPWIYQIVIRDLNSLLAVCDDAGLRSD